ncbi:MAG: DUF3108 domain-containing protein [Candidatus Cryptobacteroides sp.]
MGTLLKVFTTALLCLAAVLPLSAERAASRCLPVKSLKEGEVVFEGGESLTFVVHYKWGVINADIAKASVRMDTTSLAGRDVFHVSLFASTQKVYDSMFRVREQLDSWFTRDGFVPMKFTRSAKEGNYTCTNSYVYSWDGEQPHIEASLNNSRKGDFYVELPLDGCTFDLPLLYCLLRNLDVTALRPGGTYPMTFAVDDDVNRLHFIYYGKEDKKISGLGTVTCHKFGFQVVAGEVFSEGTDLFAWFSDDGNFIPVYFSAPLKIGQVNGRLQMFSGLKHEFTSLKEN